MCEMVGQGTLENGAMSTVLQGIAIVRGLRVLCHFSRWATFEEFCTRRPRVQNGSALERAGTAKGG